MSSFIQRPAWVGGGVPSAERSLGHEGVPWSCTKTGWHACFCCRTQQRHPFRVQIPVREPVFARTGPVWADPGFAERKVTTAGERFDFKDQVRNAVADLLVGVGWAAGPKAVGVRRLAAGWFDPGRHPGAGDRAGGRRHPARFLGKLRCVP